MTEQTPLHAQTDKITFDELGLHPLILKALTKAGYITPTPIQTAAIPHALNGRDLLLSAQTGSGKTASFVLPILDKLAKTPKTKPLNTDNFSQKSHKKHQKTAIKALILTPTRELAMQVQDNVRKYSSCMKGVFSVPLVGGAPYGGQIRALSKGVQIVIATPGRLIDHMNDGRVDLSALDVLVLDEADRMLDMGFADAIETILAQVPTTRQTVMSSATWDGQVGKIAESFTDNPERISIKVQSAHIDESVYFCDDFNHKNKVLSALLSDEDIGQAIIFTATKRSTEQLAQTLNEQGLSARYLHGDLPQGKRNRIITDVKSGKCNFLIATDVAARGIDIATISHVVNYDLPRQVEDYVHRIGRCGRAGRTGVAMNLCSRDDRRQLGHINRYLGRDMKECIIVGLEPKFTPKQDDGRRQNGRKKFDKNEHMNGRERFAKKHTGRRNDKSDDFYQKSRERAFDKFGKIDSPYERSAKSQRGETFGRSERFALKDGADNGYNPKSGLYGKKTHRDVSESNRTYHAKNFGGYMDNVEERPAKRRFNGTSFECSERGFDKKSNNDRFGKKSFGYATARPKKQKSIEEVFFDKRQAKKSK